MLSIININSYRGENQYDLSPALDLGGVLDWWGVDTVEPTGTTRATGGPRAYTPLFFTYLTAVLGSRTASVGSCAGGLNSSTRTAQRADLNRLPSWSLLLSSFCEYST